MENIISFEKIGLSFNVSRTAFSFLGIDVYWYGIIIALGLISAFIYGSYASEKEGISQNDFLNMFIIAVPCAIIGARLYYCIFSFDEYKDNLTDIFNLRQGGLAIYGGVIAAAIVVLVYCKIKKIKYTKVLDILAVGLLIGQCIGRWGNFVNGEAFGTAANHFLAMTIVSNGRTIAENVHPTFLYESLWNLLGIAVLLIYKRKRLFSGELFCLYMVWYGFGRMFIEGLRTDSLYIGDYRISQLLSAVILIVGILLIIRGRKLKKAEIQTEVAENSEIEETVEDTEI